MRTVKLVSVGTMVLVGFFIGRMSMAGAPESKLDQLGFLAGSWERQVGNTRMEEHWTLPAGGCMMGLMRQVTDGKTGIREFLLLEETDAGIIMTVKHVGPKIEDIPGRTFHMKLGKFDGKEAVFENQGEGSLKSVVYRKQDDGGLYAAIRVDRNGQVRDIELPFKRMAK